MLFSFRYSDRPNTRAAQFPEKVPEAVKARRLVELQAAQAAITLSKNGDEIGGCREILVEGPSKAGGGQWTGRTRQNRTVNFSAAEDLTGRLVMVRVTSAFSHSLKGELVP
jgi:tRNA-2-methylthio-N6-dimethylallyladenosine synthase